MHEKIRRVLRKTPDIKAKDIAKKIGSDKKSVNIFLFANDDDFVKDSNHCWALVETELLIIFVSGWMDCDAFENCLNVVDSPLDSECDLVTFVFPKACKPMLDVIARFLALCNQLTLDGKKVQLDFSKNKKTFTYFDRLGFLDHLDNQVAILPERPNSSRANEYRGKSDALVEIGAINVKKDNKELIDRLTDKFIAQSSTEYEAAVFTIFGEFINNIQVHSSTLINGFAGMQKYEGNQKHIQTVISDSGVGVFSTLETVIDQYPIFHNYQNEDNFNIYVVETVLTRGGISSFGKKKGHGLGFKTSREQATKFDANLSIRQENFSLLVKYRDGKKTKTTRRTDLCKIKGTHICFDFIVD